MQGGVVKFRVPKPLGRPLTPFERRLYHVGLLLSLSLSWLHRLILGQQPGRHRHHEQPVLLAHESLQPSHPQQQCHQDIQSSSHRSRFSVVSVSASVSASADGACSLKA